MTTILVSDIHKPNGIPYRIAAPRWSIGDRPRLVESKVPGIAGKEVIVERIDGPYLFRGADLSDAFLYRVYESEQGIRYPCSGKSLTR